MSQVYKNLASGPVPPVVATSYTTDVRDNSTNSPGTAIPASNNLDILGRDTNQQNDNGIRTDADPNNGDFIYVELTNRQTATITTTDDTLTTIQTFSLGATAGTFYFYGNVQAFNSTTPASGAYSYSGGFRTDGITATELGIELHDEFEDPSFVTADIFLSASGNNVLLQVQGVAATSINWNSLLEYRRVI